MLLRGRKRQGKDLVAIEASPAGVAIAQVVRGRDGLRLKTCEYVSGDLVPSLVDALPERIEAMGLVRSPCNWVLANSSYALLLVEAPNVPPEELREAMRWRIRDLISFSTEQATLDIFELPEDGSRGKKMVYVVVSERQRIQDTVDLARETRLTLKTIDIADMALRNLAELASEDSRGVALVRLREGTGNIVLVRGDQLYLSRQFDLDYRAGLFDDLPEEAVILELQRSLDYYERQMGQQAPARILFCGDSVSPDKITDNIRSSLPGEITCLDLGHLLPGAEQCDEHILQLCLGAIGGALRREAA